MADTNPTQTAFHAFFKPRSTPSRVDSPTPKPTPKAKPTPAATVKPLRQQEPPKPLVKEHVVAESSTAAARRLIMQEAIRDELSLDASHDKGVDEKEDLKAEFYGYSIRSKRIHQPDPVWPDAEFWRGGHVFQHDDNNDRGVSGKFSTSTWAKPSYAKRLPELVAEKGQGFFSKKAKERNKPTKTKESKLTRSISVSEAKQIMDTLYESAWRSSPACQAVLSCISQTECNTQMWTDKYRPDRIAQLLNPSHNHTYLRDWLHQMKVAPIAAPEDMDHDGRKKKRKGRAGNRHHQLPYQELNLEELSLNDVDQHGFLTTDAFKRVMGQHSDLEEEDDNDDMDFMPGSCSRKKLTTKLKDKEMKSNMILLIGEHGVGKTASVYAAAEEVGYEIFEVNAGSRRAGKDLISAVGAMAESHLVTFDASRKAGGPLVDMLQKKTQDTNGKKRARATGLEEPNKRRQKAAAAASSNGSIMKHFARIPKEEEPDSNKSLPAADSMECDTQKDECTMEVDVVQAEPLQPKQSLILLEEVDLLYEEDKGFWAALMELAQKSKRPLVMTCTDAGVIPFESLFLQAVLDIKLPSTEELLSYLQLVCLAEGYLVDPSDLLCFVAVLGSDIRQLLQTLQLWCMRTARTPSKAALNAKELNLYECTHLFAQYMGINDLVPAATKRGAELTAENHIRLVQRCGHQHSRNGVDVVRLCSHYLSKLASSNEKVQDALAFDSIHSMANIMDTAASIDAWVRVPDYLLYQMCDEAFESPRDQIGGYTRLWDIPYNSDRWRIEDEMEATLETLNNRCVASRQWRRRLDDRESMWESICTER
ncbi:hypothetical protein DFQ28_002666 [Apophysomyces sp. BC1034]|nr:hypothetical protein DFQ30_005070 [Apophysomyces sp. BC1015]KAG0179628.1 hypothetical protein DFQ29_001856 [Apophysomyces sp. BC1021]KAG0189968.1 hypothetical protein DFQ28_002666 [Apophysomyces sp. BC1034]